MRPARAIVALLAVGSAAILLYLGDPAVGAFFPPCPFRALTGLFCPGCGSLRALHRILHGDIATGLRLNPLLALVFPFTLATAAGDAIGRLRRTGPPRPLASPAWGWGAFAVILLFGTARNLPWGPFTLLAPH